MKQYVCPGCGSSYIQITTAEGVSICNVGPEYVLKLLSGESTLDGKTLPVDTAIACGACSWSGCMKNLELSELET